MEMSRQRELLVPELLLHHFHVGRFQSTPTAPDTKNASFETMECFVDNPTKSTPVPVLTKNTETLVWRSLHYSSLTTGCNLE